MKRSLLHTYIYSLSPAFLACLAGLALLFHVSAARAEVFYGIDQTGIYSVDTVNGGPTTLLVSFAIPMSPTTNAATLAVRPSDGMLFYLDNQSANPNLWRWDPSNPGIAPVLLGTPGATTTAVIRLGFDAAGTLYAMNAGAGATLWTLNPTNGAILTSTPASGSVTAGGGDICLQPGTGTLFIVAAQTLSTITPAGVVTLLGTITGLGAAAPGCAFDSTGRLVVVAGSQLYTVNIGTLTATALPQTTGAIAFGDLATGPGRKADLRLSQSVSNPTPGATVSFTISVTNDGPDRASDVRVLDLLPAGLTFVSATPSKGAYTSGSGIWTIGAMNNGSTATLTINAGVTAATPITNTAQVSYSDLADPDSTPNNSVAGEDDQASVTITPSPDLQIVKTATSSFAVGTNASYSIAVNNTLGSLTTGANSYTVTDIMPPGLTIVGTPAGTGWNCAASTATQLNCSSSAAIAAGAANPNAITLTVLPAAGAAPSVSNTATVTGGGEPASNNGNNSNTVVTTVCIAGGCPDLTVNKSVPGLTVGTISTYTLSVTNIGGLTTAANPYTLTDPLPTGLTLNAAPTTGAGWTCPANTPAAGDNVAAGGRVVCTRSTALLPGATSTTVTFPVNVANSAAPSVSNTATVTGGGEPAAATGNNSKTVVTPVIDFDLTVTKTKTTAANFVLGVNTATYTIVVNNIGARASTGTYTVTDTLPAGLTLNAAPTAGAGWTCAANTPLAGDNIVGGGRVVCSNATVLIATSGVSSTIVFPVRVGAAAAPSVSNTATVSDPNEAPALAGNNASTVITPVDAPDLIVTKTHNGNFIVGSNGVYTITVHNIGALTTSTSSVVVTDTLPTGLTFVSASGTNWVCGAVGQVVTCTRTAANAIAANDSSDPISLTVAVAASAVPGVTNPVSVTGGNEPANNNGNNSGSDVTAVYVAPQISKGFTTNPVLAGNPTKLTLTITNPGSNSVALTGLAVTDPFPAGMSVAAVPNFSNSCGGTVSPGPSQGDTLIALTGGGPLAIGASCTIQVDVVGTTTGALVNTTGQISSGNSGIGGTATATLTVNSPGVPVLTTLSSPDPVGVNEDAVLTFTINNKATATSDVGFTDTLPNNVVVSNPVAWGGSCVSTGGAGRVRTATAGLPTITVTGIDLTAGASCTITINIVSSVPGSYLNDNTRISALLGGLTANVNDTLNVRGTTLTKAFSPASIPVNGTSTLSVTLTNGTGNPAQYGLAFTESLPAGVTVKTTAPASQCNGTVTAVAGGSTITLSGGNLSLGQAACTVDVDVTSAAAATYTNLPANLSGLSAGMTNGIPGSGVALAVNPPPQLAKAFSPVEVGAGQPTVLTFTINNSAGNPAQSGLGFSDALPANLVLADGITGNTCNGTLSDASNNPLAANAASVRLAGASIASGVPGCTITVNVKSVVPATYSNSQAGGNITAAAGGLSITGAAATLNVRGTTLTKAFSPATTALNDPVTLTFTITNSGGNPAQAGLSFTDTLGGMTLSAVPASPQCGGTVSGAIGGNVAGFSGGSLGAGVASCTVVFSGVATAVGSYVNNAANMSNISPGMTNSVNATLVVNNLPSLSKAFSAGNVAIGQPTTLVFTVTNQATAPLRTGLTFTDAFPANLVIASPNGLSNGCGGSPTITATAGTGTIIVGGSGVNSAAGPSTCTISVNVTSNTAGSYINGPGQITAIAGMNNDVTPQTLKANNLPTISTAFSPASVDVYTAAAMTFTLSNSNGNSLTSANFTDTLAGFSVAAPATIGGTCVGVSSSPALAAGAASLNLTVPNLAAGSCTITIPVSASAAGSYTNVTSGITTVETGAGAGPASNTATLAVNFQALQVTKTPSVFNVSPGSTIDYVIGYRNPNASTWFQSIVITDQVPAYTTFQSAICGPFPPGITSCTISAPAVGATGTVTWTLGGTLDAGSSGTVTLSVKVD